MAASSMSVEEYLLLLKEGKIEAPRPFDKKKESVELGPKAQALTLPAFEIESIIPPSIDLVKKFYQLLQPLYDEIFDNTQFSLDGKYHQDSNTFIEPQAIIEAYLFNAILRTLPKVSFTQQVLASHVFLRHICHSLAYKIPVDNAIKQFHQFSHTKTQVTTIFNEAEGYINQGQLIHYYIKSQEYRKAYITSIIPSDLYESHLGKSIEALKDSIATALKTYEENKNSRLVSSRVRKYRKQLEKSHSYNQLCTLITTIFNNHKPAKPNSLRTTLFSHLTQGKFFDRRICMEVDITNSESINAATEQLCDSLIATSPYPILQQSNAHASSSYLK